MSRTLPEISTEHIVNKIRSYLWHVGRPADTPPGRYHRPIYYYFVRRTVKELRQNISLTAIFKLISIHLWKIFSLNWKFKNKYVNFYFILDIKYNTWKFANDMNVNVTYKIFRLHLTHFLVLQSRYMWLLTYDVLTQRSFITRRLRST